MGVENKESQAFIASVYLREVIAFSVEKSEDGGLVIKVKEEDIFSLLERLGFDVLPQERPLTVSFLSEMDAG